MTSYVRHRRCPGSQHEAEQGDRHCPRMGREIEEKLGASLE